MMVDLLPELRNFCGHSPPDHFATNMKQIQTDIEIAAPRHRVWEVLTNFAAYPQWNPFIRRLEGEQGEGVEWTVVVQPPGGREMTFRPRVIAFSENREIRWKGKLFIPGLFDGEHYFVLQELGRNRTRFIHGEEFSGLLTPLLGKMLDRTRDGFNQMNEALQRRCETVAVAGR